MRLAIVAAALAAALSFVAPAHAAGPIRIVAAENFYAEVASAVGGSHVAVTAILSNPDEDPHLFETSPTTARDIADADIVIYNGADYDPWMEKLLSASPKADRTAIIAATVTHHKSGDNPHLWYEPATLPMVADFLAVELEKRDPANAADYEANVTKFDTSTQPIADKVVAIRQAHPGIVVIATEPVFGYMADALGFKMLNGDFQLAMMNDTEPSPKQVADFEQSLKSKTAKILFYNSQVTDDTTTRLKALAEANGVKVIGVTETEPAGKTIPDWFLGQLAEIEDALK